MDQAQPPSPTQPASEAPPCRPGCGACCIAPSISSPLPGLPGGKPAGRRCPFLSPEAQCLLFGRSARPEVCSSLRPSPQMCRADRGQALRGLARLEARTHPG